MERHRKQKHYIAYKWIELSFKDKLSYIFASISFSLGWVITFIAFFLPPIGIVADSILWILGQSLLFTGAVIGIGQYYSSQMRTFKADIMDFVSNGNQPPQEEIGETEDEDNS